MGSKNAVLVWQKVDTATPRVTVGRRNTETPTASRGPPGYYKLESGIRALRGPSILGRKPGTECPAPGSLLRVLIVSPCFSRVKLPDSDLTPPRHNF